MDRLFAGPTPAESASGLRLQRSGADGFTGLSIAAQIARVKLAGRCSTGGSTFTIADEISPTLKQLATVDFVKILRPGRSHRDPWRAQRLHPALLGALSEPGQEIGECWARP